MVPTYCKFVIFNKIVRLTSKMLFYSFFKTLVGHEIIVELKNDICVTGRLHSVDQFLNIKLIEVCNYISESFIRGSVVRYVQLPVNSVDSQLLQDAARKEITIR
ncbi:U6 snRNA-associated Sm-like protein LSm2 isoform X2 [Aphis gossypii]|uniref:Sm domain-containing protein n=1 Tax=Aphis gossypii TaxID=80765 RepID=A0A9P0J6E4_APHGO|nr:U6 snRNA-associated Sm-like protein LSm2 isoform X2 [Aphis gossypii]XP_050066377.1 U6 snRNA-associated Sm-like protein LSm2 isoform X2 [Aphis gossypii]CAH1730877.1 unnamed protein product [Aphis gossypii]